jgi:hypothetical protein
MKFRLVEEFELEEEVLNEDNVYKVSVPSAKKIYYFLAGDDVAKYTSMTSCDQIYDFIENTLRKSWHEKVNSNLLNQLQSLGTAPAVVTDMSSHKGAITSYSNHAKRFLNTTYRPSRSKSNANVSNSIGSVNKRLFTDLTVHHLDGDEWNDSNDNLVGFDNDQLHQLAHILPITPTGIDTYRWDKRFNAVTYNGTNFTIRPCRVTMEIR